MIPYSRGINHSKSKVTTGGPVRRRFRGSPLCGLAVPGPRLISHLLAPISPVCHPASNMEFAAPFGTAKKGKAAQVEEVQPMAADPSSCLL